MLFSCGTRCRPGVERGTRCRPGVGTSARRQELKEDPDWEETKDEFKVRLRQTAFAIPAQDIRKAMGSMVRRCKELATGDGNYIKDD